MNWIFGKKKPPPEVYIADETPEGFLRIENPKPSYISPLPLYPPIPRPEGSDSLPYGYAAPYPPVPAAYPPQYPAPYTTTPMPYPPSTPMSPLPRSSPEKPANPLDSVPFVLSPALSARRNNFSSDVDSVRRQTQQLKDRLETQYNYDFSTEQNVIREHVTSS